MASATLEGLNYRPKFSIKISHAHILKINTKIYILDFKIKYKIINKFLM